MPDTISCRILTLAADLSDWIVIRPYMMELARMRQAEVRILMNGKAEDEEAFIGLAEETDGRGAMKITGRFLRDPGQTLNESIREVLREWPANMIAALLPSNREVIEHLMMVALDINLDTILIRPGAVPQRPNRIIIPSGGGANALRGMQLAADYQRHARIPAQVLHVLRPSAHGIENLRTERRQIRDMLRLEMELVGLRLPIRLHFTSNVVKGIVSRTRPSDLLVMGAANSWRLAHHWKGSITDEVLAAAACPALVLLNRTENRMRLLDVIWERTIRTSLHPVDKWDLLRQLIAALIEEKQVPQGERGIIEQRVFERERLGPTCAGQDMAIPHAAIPGFRGVLGVLGICPDGVVYDEASGRIVQFVFLFLTPEKNYTHYLPVLAEVARLFHDASFRRQLLECRNNFEVMSCMDNQLRLVS